MMRATLRSLRPPPRHALRVLQPRVLGAASWLGHHQAHRGYFMSSRPHRPAPGGMIIMMLAFVAAVELMDYFPGRTRPKRLMNESLEFVKTNERVHEHLGSKLVARGDRVGNSSSFATEVEHMELQDNNGRPCIRIRYNLFGPRGYATVFAEAAKDSKKGEFNFIFVQFHDTHEIVAVVDPMGMALGWEPELLSADLDPVPEPTLQERLYQGVVKGKPQ